MRRTDSGVGAEEENRALGSTRRKEEAREVRREHLSRALGVTVAGSQEGKLFRDGSPAC